MSYAKLGVEHAGYSGPVEIQTSFYKRVLHTPIQIPPCINKYNRKLIVFLKNVDKTLSHGYTDIHTITHVVSNAVKSTYTYIWDTVHSNVLNAFGYKTRSRKRGRVEVIYHTKEEAEKADRLRKKPKHDSDKPSDS